MRRKKEEVLTELPDLIEVVYKNELEDQQKAIYLAQLQQMRDRLAQVSDQEFQRSRVEILSGLMRLRQICDTPALFMEDYQVPVVNWIVSETCWYRWQTADTVS